MRVLPAVLLLLVTGCSGSDGDSDAGPTSGAPTEPTTTATGPEEPPTTTPAQTASPSEEKPKPGFRLVVDDSAFGPMLFNSERQAIYLFDVETTDEPRCYGACAQAWPPVLAGDLVVAGPGVVSNLIGITQRRDGSTQVTYGGHPLYYYVNEGPGEVLCHDVFLNGGNWYVVQPDGDRAP